MKTWDIAFTKKELRIMKDLIEYDIQYASSAIRIKVGIENIRDACDLYIKLQAHWEDMKEEK